MAPAPPGSRPRKNFYPGPAGAMNPEKYFDHGPAGAMTPEEYFDPGPGKTLVVIFFFFKNGKNMVNLFRSNPNT